MTPYSTRQACWAALLTIPRYAVATLQVAFPINSQLPPVAYVSQPFEFAFALTTFTGGTPSTTYSLTKPPPWLALDSTTRTLSGTPTTAEIGAPEFEIVASDSTGEVSTNVTLVVSQRQMLYTDIENLQSQLMTGGSVTAPDTLLLRPQQSFEFYLSPHLFEGVTTSTTYYALTSDGSPLPSWLQFDDAKIRFSGSTPPLLTPNPPQQIYSFSLLASNVIGFREANADFQISISGHILTFSTTSTNIDVVRGSTLHIPSLLRNITLDGAVVTRAQIASVNTTAPTWLNFENQDLSFNGRVPSDMVNSTMSLLVNSQGSNTANLTISLRAIMGQNATQVSLGKVSTSSGSYFSYQFHLPPNLGMNEIVNASGIDIPTWLSFNGLNLTLQGRVPVFNQPETFSMSFALSDQSSTIEANLLLSVSEKNVSFPFTASASRSSSTPTSSSTTSVSTAGGPPTFSGRKLTYLILAIALPILAICSILCIALLVGRRKKKRRREIFAQNNPDYFLPPSLHEEETQSTRLQLEPRSTHASDIARQISNSVPQIELSWAPNSHKRTRNRLAKRQKTPHDSVVGSSWDDLIDFDVQSKDSLHPLPFTIFSDAEQSGHNDFHRRSILRSSRKRPRVQSNRGFHKPPSSRVSKANSLGTTQVIDLHTRISGAGHGAGGRHTPLAHDLRKSWQTTSGTIPMFDSRPSTVVLSSFPTPPSYGNVKAMSNMPNDVGKHESRTKPTLRPVDSSSDWSNSFQAARQQYYTQRARDHLEGATRFSNVASRTSSLPDLLSKSGTGAEWHLQREDRETESSAEGKRPNLASPESHKSTGWTMRSGQRLHKRYSGLKRDTSVASSRQFDSAISSTSSVWEDENLIADRDTVGDLHWHTEGQSSSQKPSPRLPFESYYKAEDMLSTHAAASTSHKPRLADQRKHVGLEDGELERSQRSHKGSLRFV